jgi:CRP/FNR family transcriptional regulator
MQKAQWHLSENDFFKDLPNEKKEFISLSKKLYVTKDEFIFYEADQGNACFYLEAGAVKILRTTGMGKEPILMVRKSGDMFGLAEVIEGRVRKATAQAILPCLLHRITKGDFEVWISRNYSVAKRILGVMGKRLRYLCEQVENLMVCDVTTRVLKVLYYIGYQHILVSKSLNEPITFPLGYTQEHLAAMIGSTQQTISETFKNLKLEGLIRISNKEVTFLKPAEILSRIEE